MALGQLVVRLGLDAAEFTQGMSKAEAEALRFGQKMGADIRTAALGAAAAITAVAAAGVAAFKVLNDQVESIASFQSLSEKIGDTAENLASLKKASDVSGVSMDSIATASIKLSAALSKTDEDGNGAAAAIKALGLDFDTFKKLAPVDQIDAVSKAMAGFEDGAGKTAVAVALWGKSGADMIPLLNDLASGSERQVTLTEAQIKAADDFSKSMARLKSDTSTLFNQLSAELIPTLQDLLNAFTGAGDSANSAADNAKPFAGAMEFIRNEIKLTIADTLTLASGFSQLFTFIGGYAKVSGELLKGNFDQAKAVGAAAAAEIEKTGAKYDALRAKVLAAGNAIKDPRLFGDAGSIASQGDGSGGGKPTLAYSGVKTPKAAGGGAPKVSEAERYLESLQKQLLVAQDLTTNEKAFAEIQSGRLGVVTPMMSLQLQLAASAIDQAKAQAEFEKKTAADRKADAEAAKRLEDERQKQGDTYRKSVMTDQEQINALEDQYAQALDKKIIDLETYSRLMDKLAATTDKNTTAFINFEGMAQQAASSLADGLTDAIMQGKSLGDVFKNVVKQLAAMILKAIIFKVVGGVIKSYTGIDISGAKAGGGSVSQNSSYLVGEKGPELFTPSTSGKITTNAQTFKDAPVGKSGTSNVYNITAPGVSREEFMSGLNRTQAGAVSNVRDNKMRRRA
jgi:hypothetical protein